MLSLYKSHFLTINNLSFHRKEIKSVNSGLALKFFGEHKQKACEEYVERVFREYDVDESGELSYEGTEFSTNRLFSTKIQYLESLRQRWLCSHLLWIIRLTTKKGHTNLRP